MLQLVYLSVATRPVTVQSLKELCEQARANNRRDQITGILIAKEGRFLQAFEGPKELVEEAFIRIINDQRHEGLNLLSRRITTKREFGEWDMEHFEDLGQCSNIIDKVLFLTKDAPKTIRDAVQSFIGAGA